MNVRLVELVRKAESRYWDAYPDKGHGWQFEEARYHVYKAHDELSQAAYHARQANAEGLLNDRLADAITYIAMAVDCYEIDGLPEGCQ